MLTKDKHKKSLSQSKSERAYDWFEKQIDKFTPRAIIKHIPKNERIYLVIIIVIFFIFLYAKTWFLENTPSLYLLIGVFVLIILFIGINRYQDRKERLMKEAKKKNKIINKRK